MPAHKPEELHELFVAAFNQADIEALTRLYEPDALLVLATGDVKGHAAIGEAYRQLLARGGHMQLHTRRVMDSGKGLAVLHSAWAIDRGEGKAFGVSTEVVRQQTDGSWLFLLDEPTTPTS